MKFKKQGPSFSLYEFKDWMSKQEDLSNFFGVTEGEGEQHEYVGEQAYAKVSKAKFLKKIGPDSEGDLESVVDEFFEEGGTVTEVDGKTLMIEVSCGSFTIPRFCVKIKKSAS